MTGEDRRLLLELSAGLGAGRREEVRRLLSDAAGELPARPVEETLLQAYLFVGFPPVLEAFAAWRRLSRRAAGPGEESRDRPVGGRTEPDDRDPREMLREGRETCRRVYGDAYRRLRSNVEGLHPDLDRWMIREGYGKVLSRPGLDLPEREACIVALLAGARWPRQLHSHLRGALRVGAGEEAVEGALDAGLRASRRAAPRGRGEEWERRARELWDRVRRRSGEDREEPES